MGKNVTNNFVKKKKILHPVSRKGIQ